MKMNSRTLMRFGLVGLVFMLCAVPFAAFVSAQDEPKEHTLVLGRSIVVTTEKDIRRFAIGDPTIIEVVIITQKEILVNAKRLGRTNMIVWYADDSREERLVLVEQDLRLLREHLARIDKAIIVETSSDGTSILLRGTVATFKEMTAAVDITTRFLEGAATATGAGVLVEAKEKIPVPPEPGDEPAPEPAPKTVETAPPKTSALIRNLLVVRELPRSLDDRLLQAAQAYSREVRIRRLQAGLSPDDVKDSFVVEGRIRDQHALTRMLTVLDKMLGGTGDTFQVTADESGGLFTGKAGGGAARGGGGAAGGGASGGTGGTSVVPNDLGTNIGRASIVRTSTGRLMSFVKVVNIPQVLVSVRILEIDRTKSRNLGVDWSATMADYNTGTPSASNSYLPEVSNVITVVNGLLTNSLTVVDSRFSLTQTISFLESKDFLKTLAEPNLMTLSGETASFLVGGEVPVQQTTSTATAALEGIEFKEFGIRLSIRPVVGDDGTITLDIAPDISSVPSFTTTGAPNFKRTSLQTSARLKSDQGIILGGLISTDEQETTTQVPLLGDIPFLGALFRKKVKSAREREIALVLLPKLVMPKPATAFALEPPPFDLPVRAGSFQDPELGTLPSVPKFYFKNVAEGRRLEEGEEPR
jgi:Flp pilus assembly secretin CpaC